MSQRSEADGPRGDPHEAGDPPRGRDDAPGDGRLEPLIDVVYDRLRVLCAAYMARERPDHTLQATAVAHEVYLRLAERDGIAWKDGGHFLVVASRVVRELLVDHARTRGRKKRGGNGKKLPLSHAVVADTGVDLDLLDLDDALTELVRLSPRGASVVELRHFGGLTEAEIAQALGVSVRTVRDDWRTARAWLRSRLGK